MEEGLSVPEVGRVVACRRRYARILRHSRTRPDRFHTNLCQIGESPTLPEPGMPVGEGLSEQMVHLQYPDAIGKEFMYAVMTNNCSDTLGPAHPL